MHFLDLFEYLLVNNLFIIWDHEGESKIHVLIKTTGEEIWQKDRDERTGWSTPSVAELDNTAQIIAPGRSKSGGYDLENGDVIWEINSLRGLESL